MANPKKQTLTNIIEIIKDQDLKAQLKQLVAELQMHREELNDQQDELRQQQNELTHMHHELEQSRRKYYDLYDHAPIGYFTLDPTGIILMANRAGTELLGIDSQPFIDQPFLSFIDQGYVKYFLDHMAAVIKTGRGQTCELKLIRKNGLHRYVQVQSKAVQDTSGGKQILSTFIDITDRKRSEEALRKSEEKYKRIFENSVVGFFQSDSNGRFIDVNPAFASMLGYESSQEFISSTADSQTQYYVNQEDHQRYQSILKEHAIVENFEFRARRKDGSKIWLSSSTRAYDGNDDLVQYEGIIIDITERKNAIEAMRKSEERFSKAFLSSPAPMVISEIDTGRFIEVNDRWVQMLGYTNEELRGRTSKQIGIWVDPAERDRIVNILRQKGNFKNEPIVFKSKSGQNKHVLWSAEAITLADDRQVMLSLFYDQTERKKSEAEQKKLQNQLLQALKMESIGRLAGGVAHDYNNMLGVIIGYAELVMDKLGPDNPLRGDLSEIVNAARRSVEITRQLLAFSRQQTIVPRVLDLNQTIEGMLKLLRRLIGEDINLSWKPGTGLWPLKMDPSQIDQVLANFVINARDAIVGVGTIIIETQNITLDKAFCAYHEGCVSGDFIMLTVSDDGSGMDKETSARIFEPFFTTKDLNQGTGLGLATVYGIIKQNNGYIDVYSEPGKGTTFRIYLPRHSGMAEQPIATITSNKPVSRGETVLLVEDDQSIIKLVAIILERQGYQVLAADSPSEAISLARQYAGKIQLLITDVVMPEMNGRELAEQICAINPEMKTLFMSGYPANVIAHRGILEEGVNFINKPFSMKDLGDKVREALDKTNGL
jgi:two-component system, cell cycle sensor histidine kinase and response regulator CckA